MRRHLLLLSVLLAATGLRAQTGSAEGEVIRIDKAQPRITLRHGEIRALEMPPMTMSFRLASPRLLDGLEVGDRVRFTAAKVDGHYTVTTIAKAP